MSASKALNNIKKAFLNFNKEIQAKYALPQKGYRTLHKDEIEQLDKQNNFCKNWQHIAVKQNFSAEQIYGNRFTGKILLGVFKGEKQGLYYNHISESTIGDGCFLESNTLIEKSILESNVTVRACGDITYSKQTPLKNQITCTLGNELGGREVHLCPNLNYDDLVQLSINRDEVFQKEVLKIFKQNRLCLMKSFIGSGSKIEHVPFIENIYCESGTLINAAQTITNCIFLNNSGSVSVTEGSIVKSSIIHGKSNIESQSIIEDSCLYEASGTSHQAIVHHTIVGPNSSLSKGEATSCLIGPFVGFHHQSLLISVLWPNGKGNIGYGANVGSNHTGKAPDQEALLGEGLFIGLDASMKFPCNFEASPYSIISTAVKCNPQKCSLPFSLILPGSEETNHHNEIVPGWIWHYNRYMLIRNELKYAQRNKSSLAIETTILRPDIVKFVYEAYLQLNTKVNEKKLYSKKEFPFLGDQVLRHNNLKQCTDWYKNCLQFFTIETCTEILIETPSLKIIDRNTKAKHKNWSLCKKIIKNLGFHSDRQTLFKDYLDLSKEMLKAVKRSLERDHIKGNAVFDDYDQVHSPIGVDYTIAHLKEKINSIKTYIS